MRIVAPEHRIGIHAPWESQKRVGVIETWYYATNFSLMAQGWYQPTLYPAWFAAHLV
jgi:hypothetical protein